MNETVRKIVPVSHLPQDLRGGFDPRGEVEIQGPGESRPARPKRELLREAARLRAEGLIRPVSAEEAVRRIRELRDE